MLDKSANFYPLKASEGCDRCVGDNPIPITKVKIFGVLSFADVNGKEAISAIASNVNEVVDPMPGITLPIHDTACDGECMPAHEAIENVLGTFGTLDDIYVVMAIAMAVD